MAHEDPIPVVDDNAALAAHPHACVEQQQATRMAAGLALLSRASRALHRTRDVDAALSALLDDVARVFGADAAVLALEGASDTPGRCLGRWLSEDHERAVQGQDGVAAIVRDTRAPVVLPEVEARPDIVDPGHIAHGVRSLAAFPVLSHRGQLGTLSVYGRSPRHYDDSDLGLLSACAEHLGTALETATLYEQAQAQARELAAREEEALRLNEVTREVAGSLDADRVLDAIVEKALQLVGCDASGIFRYDEERGGLVYLRGVNLDDRHTRHLFLKPGEGVGGRAFQERRPVWTRDGPADPRLVYSDPTRDMLRSEAHRPRAMLAVPMISHGTVLGVLMAHFFVPHDFTDREIRLVSTLADNAAVALANARLYEAARRREREATTLSTGLSLLNQASRALHRTLEVDAMLDGALRELATTFGAEGVLLNLLSDNGEILRRVGHWLSPAHAEAHSREAGKRTGVTRHVIRTRAPLLLRALGDHPDFVNPANLAHGVTSLLGVPVIGHGGRFLAVLVLYYTSPQLFPDSEVRLLSAYGDQLATALENVALYEEAQSRAVRTKRLAEVSQVITSSLRLQDIFDVVAAAALDLLHVDLARIWVVDETEGLIKLAAFQTRGVDEDGGGARTEFPLGQGVVGWVIANKAKRYSPNVFDDPMHINREWMRARGYVTHMAVPLLVGDRALGALVILTKKLRRFSQEDEELLEMFAASVATALDNARLYERTSSQQARLAQIFDSTSDGIVLVDGDGEIASANRRAAELLAFDPSTVIGMDLIGLLALHFRTTAEASEGVAVLRAALQQAEAALGDVELPGVGRTLHWTVQPTRDAAGGRVGVTVTFRDVTEEREISRMKSDFVSFVTHQLRTPLAGIKWMLELAAQDPDAIPPDLREYVDEARQAAERLIGLVNDLLDISRLESGRLTMTPKETDLVEMTRGVIADVGALLEQRGHRLRIAGGEGLRPICVDPQLVRQVILNLTSNAIKYTPPGGDVLIQLREVGSALEWSVRDSGIGIPKESQRRLFEKFYRAENAATVETEGTGLGLYLVRLIVDKCGGRIGCESEEGKGSTFSFTLPREECQDGSHD